jgi:catechol 2,3-dioxygenase-like lactoylglutathione lyase family enzyme
MESTISRLLATYERGKMSRRELVQGLALLAAASGTASAAGFQGSSINHVSLYVSDLKRSSEFYQRVFGAAALQREGNVQLSFGKGRIVIRPGNPPGKVDHFAIGIDGFKQDSVIADLKARGVTPQQTQEAGLHVNDPDGFPIQLSGNDA